MTKRECQLNCDLLDVRMLPSFKSYKAMEIEKLYPLALMALVALCYCNSLRCGLVFDDIAAISDNRDIRPHTPMINIFQNDFWGTPLRKEHSHKSYRPLTILSFRLNYAVHGLEPMGYHLVNILLHAFVCHLFYKLCLHFFSGTSSLVSSALFAVHPVHTEAVGSYAILPLFKVTGVVGRAELLSAAAFVGALLYYVHHRYLPKANAWKDCGVTSLFAVIGLLCKEQAITVLAVCCVYELFTPKSSNRVQSIRHLILSRGLISPWWKDKFLRLAILASVATFSLHLRWKVIGGRLPVFNRFDNPAAVSDFPTRQLTYNYLLAVNTWLLLFPYYLCCDWTMSTIPLVSSLWDSRNIATIAVYLALFYVVKAVMKLDDETKMTLLMGLLLVVIPFLPASNLLFPVGFVVAERVLYIPSMGFCMLVAQGWSRLFEKRYRHWAILGITFILIVNAFKTIIRNKDWQNEYTLYKSSLSVNQRNGKLFNNMGQVLEALNRPEEALQHYESARRIEPNDVRSFLNIGRVLTHLHRYKEAEEIYQKAQTLLPGPEAKSQQEIHVTPSHLQLFLNLASLISQNASRLEEADAIYKKALMLRSDFTKAYLNRGDVLLKLNRTKEAEAMYHRALEYDDTNPDLYFNLGVVLMDQGRNSEALEFFNKALDVEPDHEKSLEFSAILMQGSSIPNHRNLAKVRLEKIIDRGKETERMYINLGLIAVANKNFPSAEKWFRKALQKDPNSREALFNLALLLSEQHRQAEAVFSLDQLLQYYPDHISGLLLLADINVNYFKDLDAAEKCYKRVLKIDPANQKALHNLCVLHFQRQDYEVAERCFVHTLTLYPGVSYIRDHLDIVRSILQQGRNQVFEHLVPYSVS
ncbi:protein O-mannosyl-transferase TMTC3 [Caerostris darwini]|uniref:dolichyl-phosphate-mannose--protein mannosyltransferase n=1 Tax=Caerostris darwini TaxID=1538125 RepID=A0AAV4R1M6_9ARAC|nr:protein O-mannosyl-transferase TMTC3 [Caerostris darwini]